ncbi:MAG: molybdopterin-guanine dinucleotide biosynthesis protein B [Alphaproteobacteria bacterium]|nr:molybdopterin-guanine dinucleotide biosynthesis protein B [Alphaproteobacteria bacterium]
MRGQKIFGVVGWKNSGKTTLIVSLLQEFRKRGLRVSTIKHAHHAFDIDRPGKDSHRHREAGAAEVLVMSSNRWALMHENCDGEETALDELVGHLAHCDLVLVEGFKADRHPKIETAWANATGLIAESDPTVLAVVTDRLTSTANRRVLSPGDIVGIADFILRVLDIQQATRGMQPASPVKTTRNHRCP